MNKPNFIGIGGMRCGTTWLDAMLRLHPDINMPKKKEIHYFDWNYRKGDKWYLEQFPEGFTGEITPGYSILNKNRIKQVKKLLPDVKIILILRNPIERAYSHALFDFRKKNITPSDKDFIDHFNSKKSILKGSYCSMIKKWEDYFPMLIPYYDYIQTNPNIVFKNVCQFIGTTPINLPDEILKTRYSSTKNKGVPDKFKKPLINIYEKEIINLYHLRNNKLILNWLK